MLERIFHINACIRAFNRSLNFYRDILGMTIVLGPVVARERMSVAFGIEEEPDAQNVARFLRIGDDPEATVLCLTLWERPPFTGNAYKTANNVGLTHIAFKTAGIEQLHASLSAKGFRFISDPEPLGAAQREQSCCFIDPDGTLLRLIETTQGQARASKLEGVFAVSITVRDLARSLPFYRDVLGMQVVRGPFEVEGPNLARAFPLHGEPTAKLRGVWLNPGTRADNSLVELVEWQRPQTMGDPYPVLYHIGIPRVAFYVNEIHDVYETLVTRGVRFISPPQVMRLEVGSPAVKTILHGNTVAWCFLYDPDGTVLEILTDNV